MEVSAVYHSMENMVIKVALDNYNKALFRKRCILKRKFDIDRIVQFWQLTR